MRAYLDASAAAKLIKVETESAAMTKFVNDPAVSLVSSWLLVTELRRLAYIDGIPQAAVSTVLDGFDILPLLESDFEFAGILPSRRVRSLDALHLTVASQARVDHLVTYDARMKEAALTVFGLSVLEPGREQDDWLPPGHIRLEDIPEDILTQPAARPRID
ncbi:MAG: type II toxin-antitoxin system VapC family toxin [Promicromonosporaceae bacterium]|nr:type II toxin-antitoxin system VapC family toxin [Promicromonosporaceae bacterium]